MESNENSHDNISTLQKQLSLARSEINNLRQEIKSLKYSQTKEIVKVQTALKTWKCATCQTSAEGLTELEKIEIVPENGSIPDVEENSIRLKPIGFINTGFARKRAVPRQPITNLGSHGKVSLYSQVFTNPEHSLEGLDGFSHMWILFHFHKNQSNHIRAKVAPPRLNGSRVGVFGTRSPHRPCPIGLSLVQIDKIEGSSIYFSGVDMVDGTPVLDLKPYIPHYDSPGQLSLDPDMERLALDGQESDPEAPRPSCSAPRPAPCLRHTEREAPDGEEGATSPGSSRLIPNSPSPTHRHVRVPDWISRSPVAPLQVTFTPQAESLLTSLQGEENLTRVISDILCEDPRSVYLRDRYTNQFYTFLINKFHVSCKFDDNSRSVKVFRIVPAGTLCECGQPQWQCAEHGGSTMDT